MSSYLYDSQSFNIIANEDSYLAQISNEDKTNISNDSISSEKESIENKEDKNDLFPSIFKDIETYIKNIIKPYAGKRKEAGLDGKFECTSIFKVNKMPFLEKDINNLIKKMNIDEETKKLLYLNEDDNNEELIKLRNQLFIKDKYRVKNKKKNSKFLIAFKLGRKTKNDKSNRFHNKYSPDNIINSIKTKLNNSLLLFLNKLICSIYSIEQLNHFLSELKLPKIKASKVLVKNARTNNKGKVYYLNLLNLTIKDYISQNISPKTINLPFDYNKKIIQKLLEDEENKDIFNFIFNELKIEDWLDIYLYKKEIDDFIDNNEFSSIIINEIKESLIRIDKTFLEMKKDDKLYLNCFTLMIYNYKRYFSMKEERALKIIKNN